MKIQTYNALALVIAICAASGLAGAGEVDVVNVTVRAGGGNVYGFDVTLQHGDEGWDHYADRWEIRDAAGAVLATRVLAHPHVNEQPFTRSLGAVPIDPALQRVTIAGHDSVHGYGGVEMIVDLPQ